MDVHAAMGDERMLRRVIALLVALAVLAERVADRSPWVRCFVLWLLRRAETAAGGFAFDVTGMPPAPDAIAAAGNGPDDALRLAARLRALAAALGALLPAAGPFGRWRARPGLPFGAIAPVSGHGPGGWAQEPKDTS